MRCFAGVGVGSRGDVCVGWLVGWLYVYTGVGGYVSCRVMIVADGTGFRCICSFAVFSALMSIERNGIWVCARSWGIVCVRLETV